MPEETEAPQGAQFEPLTLAGAAKGRLWAERLQPQDLNQLDQDTKARYQDFLKMNFTKIEPVDMGSNLEKRQSDMQGAQNRDQARGLLREFLFNSAKLKKLGAIAVFDLIVTNNDRFPEQKTRGRRVWVPVAIKNIDFSTAGQPIALDNVSPITPWIVGDNWPGKVHLESALKQKEYAKMVLQAFVQETESTEYYENKSDLVSGFERAFYEGMREGTRKLKSLVPELRDKLKEDTDQFGKNLGRVIADRISSTAS